MAEFSRQNENYVTKKNFSLFTILVSRPQKRDDFNPLRPNSDPSQTSHCNMNGLSVREVMRIENMITQVKFY